MSELKRPVAHYIPLSPTHTNKLSLKQVRPQISNCIVESDKKIDLGAKRRNKELVLEVGKIDRC